MTAESREEVVLEAVGRRRERVNEAIEEDLPVGEPARLYEASRSIIVAGGKRLRPAMVLLVAEALTDTGLEADYRAFETLDDQVIDVLSTAVSIEVIHSFTLIHDDIMDDDEMRRGTPAVHERYDTETAILAGDTLYSKAFEIMLDTGGDPNRLLEAVDMLAETCTRICEGQAMDVDFETDDDVLPDDYQRMIQLKTAVLYAASAALPAIVCGADDAQVEALHRYGMCVGQAFQIQDDLLDLTTPSEELGKQRGSDLVEGKRTIITLHAREQGVDVDALIEADDPEAVSEAEIDAVVERLEEAGSLDYARRKAEELIEEGKRHLDTLPDNESRATLEALADYLVDRSY